MCFSSGCRESWEQIDSTDIPTTLAGGRLRLALETAMVGEIPTRFVLHWHAERGVGFRQL